MRIVLADDHTLVRAGTRSLLVSIPDVQVVAESDDGREALELIARHRPDVALIDIGMPGLSGVEVARRVAKEKVNETPTTNRKDGKIISVGVDPFQSACFKGQ